MSFAINKEYWKNTIDSLVLIYRYSESICGNCYNEDIAELSSFLKEIGRERILILPAFDNNRDNTIRLNNELKKFNFQNTSIDLLTIPEYRYNKSPQRYFALINEKKDIELIFFPHLGKKELTQLYFSEIKKRLLE